MTDQIPSQTLSETSDSRYPVTGRLLTPHFTWVLGGRPPLAGYSLGQHEQLYRNGELVGYATLLVWDRGVGSYWVHYKTWRGSWLDMHGRAAA